MITVETVKNFIPEVLMKKNFILFLSVFEAFAVCGANSAASAGDERAGAGVPAARARVSMDASIQEAPTSLVEVDPKILGILRMMGVDSGRIAMATEEYNRLNAISKTRLSESVLKKLAIGRNASQAFFDEIAQKAEEFRGRFLDTGSSECFSAWIENLIETAGNPIDLDRMANESFRFAATCAKLKVELGDITSRELSLISGSNIRDFDKFVGECKEISGELRIPFAGLVGVLSENRNIDARNFIDVFRGVENSFEPTRDNAMFGGANGTLTLLAKIPGKRWGDLVRYLNENSHVFKTVRLYDFFLYIVWLRGIDINIAPGQFRRLLDGFLGSGQVQTPTAASASARP